MIYDSSNRKFVDPNLILSPWNNSVASHSSPFTKLPFVEPRSCKTHTPVVSMKISAWARLMFESSTCMSALVSLPITVGFASKW